MEEGDCERRSFLGARPRKAQDLCAQGRVSPTAPLQLQPAQAGPRPGQPVGTMELEGTLKRWPRSQQGAPLEPGPPL